MNQKGVSIDGEAILSGVTNRINKLTSKKDCDNTQDVSSPKVSVYSCLAGQKSAPGVDRMSMPNAGTTNDNNVSIRDSISTSTRKEYPSLANLQVGLSTTKVLTINHNASTTNPCVLNIADIFRVPFNTLADIKNLINDIEMGKHKVEWLAMTCEQHQDVMDAIFTKWKVLMAKNPSELNDKIVGNMAEPRSYVGAAGGSKPKPNKSKANFHSISSENLCEGTNFSIPRKVVETVSVPPTVVTPTVGIPTVEKTNDGFQTVGKKKKKKGKTKSTNGGQFGGNSVKQTVRYEPKATISVPKKEVTNPGNTSTSSSMLKNQLNVASDKEGNIIMSNSYAALDDESEEDVENVYNESANLIYGTQTGESSSTFMVPTS
ncbi:hypothetical protein Tco_0871948 [Tanacetum coccineum]